MCPLVLSGTLWHEDGIKPRLRFCDNREMPRFGDDRDRPERRRRGPGPIPSEPAPGPSFFPGLSLETGLCTGLFFRPPDAVRLQAAGSGENFIVTMRSSTNATITARLSNTFSGAYSRNHNPISSPISTTSAVSRIKVTRTRPSVR